jgi:cytochrome P450
MVTAEMSAFDREFVRFLKDPNERTNPYPFYRRMRERGPVYFSEQMDTWFVTGLEEVQVLTRHPAISNVPRRGVHGGDHSESRARRGISKQLLYIDPPLHTNLRGLASRLFLPRTVEVRRERIAEMVAEIVEEMGQKKEVEFLREIATQVPLLILCELLGLPPGDKEKFLYFTERYLALLEPTVSPEVEAAGERAYREFCEYIGPLIDASRAVGADDETLLGALASAEARGELSREDVENYLMFLVQGGHETTAGQLTNGLYLMLRHPDQWEKLREDPSCASTAVEEMVRFEGAPRNLVARWAASDLDIGGSHIAEGDRIVAILGAANRDPRVFDQPDRFDVTRAPNRHVGFGFGSHACLGAPLARVELQEFFRLLPQRLPSIELSSPVEWRPTWTFRIPAALRVKVVEISEPAP